MHNADLDPAERLTAIGLPPRPRGWVPQQPSDIGPPVVETSRPEVASPGLMPGRLDELRHAVADRLPPSLAARVEQATNRAVLTTLAAVVTAVVIVVVRLHGHHGAEYPAYGAGSYPDESATSAPIDPTADGSSIVVDVKGHVRHPGLVTLPLGARVADAIRAAGGVLRRRELARVDLAARVADGQLLRVGGRSDRSATGGDSAAPVSLSTASLAELDALPGVGPVTAQKIIDWRTAHGGFTSVSQLQQVSGIGPARYAQLSPLVTP